MCRRSILRLLLLLLPLMGGRAVAQEHPAKSPQEQAVEQLQKLNRFYRYLNGLYVDSVELEPLVEQAIRAMLGELDPHSAYLDPQEMEAERISIEGEFSGIGVEFRVLADTIRIQHILAGGAAERSGLRAGDRILSIDTLRAVGLKQHEVPTYLRGKQGSKVELEVWRPVPGERLHFTLVRDKVSLHTVSAAYRLDEQTGYVKIDRFGRTTAEEFEAALKGLGRIESLILDLQGNGGGLLHQAIRLAEHLLPQGSLIVSTEGRAVAERAHTVSRKGLFRKGRLILLVDEYSASASEIVSGAVQDWDRGLIVGRPTFGKGLVQRQVGLGDGSAVRITIARYHTPSGRVIQRPYQAGEREAYYAAQRERLGRADSLSDTLPRYRTLRLGREVVGGGGIQPDLVVPIDTTGYTPYYGALVRAGVIGDFVSAHVDRHRSELLTRYPTYEAFFPSQEELQQLYAELRDFAQVRGIAYTDAAQGSEEWILRQLRTTLAMLLYGSELRVRALNDAGANTLLNAALELLRSSEHPYTALLNP